MYRKIMMLCLLAGLLSGCNLQERENALRDKEKALLQKEQELSLKEQLLNLREEQLESSRLAVDSLLTVPDSLIQAYPNLPGTWSVRMVCSETNCEGSAIGDVITEVWNMSIHNNIIFAGSINNNQLTRVYSGGMTGPERVVLLSESAEGERAVRMIIRLKRTNANAWTGTREIIRPDECHIVYDLELKKQKQNL